MYSMKNGILYNGGKPEFVLGVSYYPSFLKDKCPVPEDGDRIGEMKKDLRRMKECGFNLLRTAALGEVKAENDRISVQTDFIDAMLRRADEEDIAVMVRLHGYTMDLRGNKDYFMVNQSGKRIDESVWQYFIRNSLFHKGILRDIKDGTCALAEHFSNFKNLVAFQTYNEPHLPGNEICDYSDATVNAYREWLVQQGIMTAEEAENYEPPRERPQKDADLREWANWRVFLVGALCDFLNNTEAYAKEVCPSVEGFTCLVNTEIDYGNGSNCMSYAKIAEKMDYLGITCYINPDGAEAYKAAIALDDAESAAAMYGKHLHLSEYDARTNIPLKKLRRETYLAVGAGVKGITYYQWRGDYPAENSPEINKFGFINYDGSETENFDEKIKFVKFIKKMSDYIVNAEKLRSGVGILYSHYAYMLTDGAENGARPWGLKNSYLDRIHFTYKELRDKFITPDILTPECLAKNPLGTEVLYVSDFESLSETEQSAVSEFAKTHRVFVQDDRLGAWGYDEYGRSRDVNAESARNIEDILFICNIRPFFRPNTCDVMVNTLKGPAYLMVVLNNINSAREHIDGLTLESAFDIKSAVLYTPDQTRELKITGNTIEVGNIADGAIIVINENLN